ncbi:hypothetical protein ARMGADRAFT_1092356 [Armillaria gallica]|uniref:Uncharacterized protein n=1 Tax=Armillaria gallica TaxID=47427 RepID=A0A2H3CPK8_ARMGA|nr:hypothetical protein ARMGADRAFT_1092356 [Armillaria gallica]
MPHFVDVDSCLQTAKLITAAGEMAPFTFIKGVAGCVVVILENIQKAENNRSDMRELAKSIVNTLVAVRDTVIEHGPSSALCFQKICIEFQTYLADLLSKLNSEDRSLRGIQRFFKAKKISDDINGYWKQVQATKEDFLIRTTTTTRATLSDVQDQITTRFSALTDTIETSERNIALAIKDNNHNIEEICTLEVQQSETLEKIQTTLQVYQQRGLYKGVVRDFIPGDIYLTAAVPYTCYYTSHHHEDSDFDEYHAMIDDCPKLVRVFRVNSDRKEQVMQINGFT